MLTRNKKIAIILGGILVPVVVALSILWYVGILGSDNRRLYRTIKDRPELVTIYNQAQADKEKIKQDPENVSAYLDLGLNWKSLGDLSSVEKNAFYDQALAAYDEGARRFGSKNILFYLNAGKVAEIVGQYDRAEQNYKQAIAISAGDENGYIYLATLYEYFLHKSKEEIVAVYNQGGQKLFNPLPIIAARGSYLRRAGENQAALEDYKVLAKQFPDNAGYQAIIAELEAKIKASK